MTLTAPSGVLSLRDALRRARKAGASVEQVRGSDDWRISVPGRKPLIVSGARKDETPELHKIVRELEAAMPAQLAQPAPPLPPSRPGSFRDRVVAWIDSQPSDPDGWISYPGSGKLGAAIGLDSTNTAVTVNQLEKAGYAELRRTVATGGPQGARITHLRLTGAVKPQRPIQATERRAVRDYRDQPLRMLPKSPAERIGPVPGVPDTPKLADYADARKLAKGNPMLRAEPSAADLDTILSEAVRLFWWIRSERR